MKLQELKRYLSASQTAKKYKLARQNVLLACKSGRFSKDEAVETSVGWLISPEAAEKIWEYRTRKNCPECGDLLHEDNFDFCQKCEEDRKHR